MRESRIPEKYDIYDVELPRAMVVATIENNELLHKNYKEALKVSHCQEAIESEFKALMNNKTWNIVPLNRKVNVIGTKWVFKVKRKEDDTIEITQGFKQHKDIDYDLIYSSVVKSSTVRIIYH